jgi:hypothetical protein
VGQSTSGRYYREVWIIPEGNRFSEPGVLIGVGPAPCELRGGPPQRYTPESAAYRLELLRSTLGKEALR